MINQLNSSKILLLPYKFKIPGAVLLILGITLGVVRFSYGIKLPIFDLTVFAVYSKYIEEIVLSPITNHYSEEIAGILILFGMLFIALSKERNELSSYSDVRLKAMILAIYINSGILLFALLFVFGFGFMFVLIINMYLLLFIYYILFRILIARLKIRE